MFCLKKIYFCNAHRLFRKLILLRIICVIIEHFLLMNKKCLKLLNIYSVLLRIYTVWYWEYIQFDTKISNIFCFRSKSPASAHCLFQMSLSKVFQVLFYITNLFEKSRHLILHILSNACFMNMWRSSRLICQHFPLSVL